MKPMKFFVALLPAFLVMAILPAFSSAAGISADQVASDFSVLEARVIQGPQDHWLINQGGKQDVEKGDLFTLYQPAQSVTDPETGETLGKFAPPAATARVVQVHERFSQIAVQCLDDRDCSISSGMKAVRHDRVKAWFVDETGDSADQYKLLRSRLDHLDWQEYRQSAGQGPDSGAFAWGVVFVADSSGLTVWSGGQVRGIYRADEKAADRARPAPAAKPAKVAPAAKSAAVRALPGMGTPMAVSGFAAVASFDTRADHMGVAKSAGSGTSYLVFLSGRTITARSLEGSHTFEYKYPGFGEVVSLSCAGDHLLAVNIYDPDAGMRSKILEVTDNGFEQRAKGIAYVLGFMSRGENGKSPRLWGQRFSRTDLLLPVVHELELKDGGVETGKRIDVPFGFSLFGAFYGDVNADDRAELGFFNPGGRLVVYQQENHVWEASDKFVPSYGSFLVADPENPDVAPSKVAVWGQPALFSQNQRPFAAIPLNSAGFSSMVGGGPGQGTVGIFFGQDNVYRLQRLADHFQGPIQDVAVYDGKLLICVAEGGFFSQGARSHVVSVPLSELVP
ncbi:MAG: hypothetical protein KFF46_07840 [Desulfobacterales bacterium]|nr:hypothetical protein [Desulfobacterales bacterium]